MNGVTSFHPSYGKSVNGKFELRSNTEKKISANSKVNSN